MPANRTHHVLILLAILLLAALLRLHKITRESDTLDELWSLSLATGRAENLPEGKILNPPPSILFEGAPASRHVWTSMDYTTHPPLYFILLRWWIDFFGSSDFSIRLLSVLFSLIAIMLIFDTVRRISGPPAGLLAAAALAFAWSSIDLSQDARNYTINFVLILLATQAVIRVEQTGLAPGKLIQLLLASAATLLTHYFCLFTLIGIGAYALFILRGRPRIFILGTLLTATLLAALIWGNWLAIQFRQRDALTAVGGVPWAVDKTDFIHHCWLAVKILAVHLYGKADLMSVYEKFDLMSLLTIVFAALLMLVIPLFSVRRKPVLLIFWFQIVSILIGVTAMDIARHTSMMDWQRYTSMAVPALCALAVAPLPLPQRLPNFWKWSVPTSVLLSLLISAAAQYQIGPRSKEDFRFFADKLHSMAGPNDLLVFYTPDQIPPFDWLLALDHYHPNSRPILFLRGRPTPQILASLPSYSNHLFLIGPNAPADCPRLLPGWKPTRTFINVEAKGVPSIGGSIAQLELIQTPP